MHSYSSLKKKQRNIRSGFSSDVGLRVHRCLSWLNRAEQASDDFDASFIFYWISFNAAYAEEIRDDNTIGERSAFDGFFHKLIELDSDNQIYDTVWDRFSQSIRLFLDNQYIFQPFWKYQNHVDGYDDWKDRFDRSKRRFNRALVNHDTRIVLGMLFDRLYVLRNQLVHGGATWNSSVNRDQVRDGARILGFLVPIFVDLIMDHPEVNWGLPYYPVVD
jgi:hypothetical protein